MNKENNVLNTRRAFTMAETLMTIMIIGILVALMLRTINRINPDKDKLLFLKSYHAAENAISNVINDTSKYDDTYYTASQIAAMSAAERADLHLDFSYSPIPDAEVTYTNASGNSVTKSSLSSSNAICYFLADQVNTIGAVNCESAGSNANTMNFRMSNGVCFYGWSNAVNGSVTGKIDPQCSGEGYEVKVFKDGKMTVPPGTEGSAQRKAYEWLQNQTEIK